MPYKPLYQVVNGWPVLDIGRLRHQITVQQFGAASPPAYTASGPNMAWTTFTTAMASIEIVRGTDVIKGGQTTTQLFLTVGMWWQPGILPNMRVVSDNGSTYVIQSIENILELDVVLVINCIALGANE